MWRWLRVLRVLLFGHFVQPFANSLSTKPRRTCQTNKPKESEGTLRRKCNVVALLFKLASGGFSLKGTLQLLDLFRELRIWQHFLHKCRVLDATRHFTESTGFRQYWNTASGRSPCATKNMTSTAKLPQKYAKRPQKPYDFQTRRNSQKHWNPLRRL